MAQVGLSMASLGELAFVAAGFARRAELFTDGATSLRRRPTDDLFAASLKEDEISSFSSGADDFASVCLTVVLSLLICPTAQRLVLNRQAAKAQAEIERAAADVRKGQVFYKLDVRCLSRMGLSGDILRTLHDVGCAIMDFRMETQGELALYEVRFGDPIHRLPFLQSADTTLTRAAGRLS